VLKRDFFHGTQVRLDGRPVCYRVPRPAVRDGIYVTEDRPPAKASKLGLDKRQ
jgi:hypothetical protein